MKISIVAQIAALLLSGAAVVWGLFAVYGVIFPGPSGEWAVLVVIAAYVVNVPVALVGLVVGFTVRQGSAGLRWLCVVVSLVALCLPVLVSLLSASRGFWR